jgi:hypothetical protein
MTNGKAITMPANTTGAVSSRMTGSKMNNTGGREDHHW